MIEGLQRKMHRATEQVIATRSRLADNLEYWERWHAVAPSWPEIPSIDLLTAALVVAVDRCRRAVLMRGVWP